MSSAPVGDIHAVKCHADRVPHDHGIACHSTCPTCAGEARWVDLMGIDPDYTEGVPADEWLEENRGEA